MTDENKINSKILITSKDLTSSITDECIQKNIIYIGNRKISSKSFTRKIDPKTKRNKMLEQLKKEKKHKNIKT